MEIKFIHKYLIKTIYHFGVSFLRNQLYQALLTWTCPGSSQNFMSQYLVVVLKDLFDFCHIWPRIVWPVTGSFFTKIRFFLWLAYAVVCKRARECVCACVRPDVQYVIRRQRRKKSVSCM